MERENILTAVELGIITHAQARELLRKLIGDSFYVAIREKRTGERLDPGSD